MKRTYVVLLVAFSLPACQSSVEAPTAPSTASSVPASLRPERRQSWMAPGVKTKQLLYVSEPSNWNVVVFDYRTGKQVGLLSSGLDYPEGMCVDRTGNVWIANSGAYNMVEFAHGGTKPIATLDDNSFEPVSCAVNPTNGDLAVGNILYFREGLSGNIGLFKGAAGNETFYGVAAMYSYYFVGYDDKGNLFFDGSNAQPGGNGEFEYAELPSGSSTAHSIALSGGSVGSPGNVQWDGRKMAVGDQSDSVIYQTLGGTIVGHTSLFGAGDIVGFSIRGTILIGPDAENEKVMFFHYPEGGSAYKTWATPAQPAGVVVSK